jgi:hypothetical protein
LSRRFSAAIKLQCEAKLEVQVPRGLSEFRELFGEVLKLEVEPSSVGLYSLIYSKGRIVVRNCSVNAWTLYSPRYRSMLGFLVGS